jgi:hypothetical protein
MAGPLAGAGHFLNLDIMKRRTVFLLTTTFLIAACSDSMQTNDAEEPRTREHVDSILTTEESIRRFKAGLPPGPEAVALLGGAHSRDALVNKFVSALEAADTMALRAMTLNAREYIDLYYPHSEYTVPPYQLGADILWIMITENGEKGYRRLVQRVAGKPLGYEGYVCPDSVVVQEKNRIVDGCRVRRSTGEPREVRLFSGIIERDGHFKFISYANDM